jgi:hypothetical protein
MTLVSTKYNAAQNWSQRLPIARDIWAEIRAERPFPNDSYTEIPIKFFVPCTNKLVQIEEKNDGTNNR